MAEIDIGAIYPLYKGAWSSGAAYDFLDMVIKDGSSYLCIAEDGAPAGTAVTNTTYWGQVAQRGEQGPKGDTGPQGPKGDTGATGPQGPKGATGATGPQGPAGPSGVYTGPLKPTATYWVKAQGKTFTLPIGGTWAYWVSRYDGQGNNASVAAGGTQVLSTGSDNARDTQGFAWRIQ